MVVKFDKTRPDLPKEVDPDKEYHATEAIIHSCLTEVNIAELDQWVNSVLLTDDFWDEAEEAIHYFNRHDDAVYCGIFIRDYI